VLDARIANSQKLSAEKNEAKVRQALKPVDKKPEGSADNATATSNDTAAPDGDGKGNGKDNSNGNGEDSDKNGAVTGMAGLVPIMKLNEMEMTEEQKQKEVEEGKFTMIMSDIDKSEIYKDITDRQEHEDDDKYKARKQEEFRKAARTTVKNVVNVVGAIYVLTVLVIYLYFSYKPCPFKDFKYLDAHGSTKVCPSDACSKYGR